MPNGHKSDPKTFQNAAGVATRKSVRNYDLPGSVGRPPPPGFVSLADLPPTPPGVDNGNPRLRFGKKLYTIEMP